MMETDFRHTLRAQTRVENDRLDQMITTLDIAQLADFKVFLKLHHSCFVVMWSRAADQGRSNSALSGMIDCLAADLEICLGEPPSGQAAASRGLGPFGD
jgi:hypothetical protein